MMVYKDVMHKQMDFRPVDTVNIITTRNLIRVNSLFNLLVILIYISIEPYFEGSHMSWIHLFHVVLQPLVLFVSIADSTTITYIAMFLSITAAAFDSAIGWLNFVAVRRCLDEPTASCATILWEKGTWTLVALSLIMSDVALTLRLWTLSKSLRTKDENEKENIEKYESALEQPILRTIHVHNEKLRIIHLFLIVPGVVYSILCVIKALESGIYWAAIWHIFIDIYGVSVSKTHDLNTLWILLCMVICATVINFIVLLQMDRELAFLLSLLYMFGDSLIIYFTASNIDFLNTKSRKLN